MAILIVSTFFRFFITLLQELAQLELLCEQLYAGTETATRNAAERTLTNFTSSADCLTKCQFLLERGNVSDF